MFSKIETPYFKNVGNFYERIFLKKKKLQKKVSMKISKIVKYWQVKRFMVVFSFL